MSPLVKRAKLLFIGAGLFGAAVASCGERSLVLLNVQSATSGVTYANDTLVITASQQQTTTFRNVSFGDQSSPFRAGVYLSSDISGQVLLKAEVDDPRLNCVVGRGSVTVDGVSAGESTPVTALPITAVEPCEPISGGTGGTGTGTGGGSPGGRGGGNATGGGKGTGGIVATGGTVGSGGVVGTGGIVGSGGALGTGGAITGTGGVVGTGGGKGTGGAGGMVGSGGVVGTGGQGGVGGMPGTGGKGTGGIVATGGMVGSGGVVGTGGVTGSGGAGTGGVVGSGGISGCGCTIPNGVCDSTGKCVCSQSDADACSAAGVGCGKAMNICQQSVACQCPANSTCDSATGTCKLICIGGTGGAILAASPICPVAQ
jgi:hypothetical protein